MSLEEELLCVLDEIVDFFLFRKKKTKERKEPRTRKIGIVFHTEKPHNMGAPTSTGTTQTGTPLFATLVAIEASGANSGGVISNPSIAVSDPTVFTATLALSASGVTYIEIDPVAAGTATLTVTATVTDTNGVVDTFTAVATVTVTAVVTPTGLTTAIEILFSSTVPA